MSPKILYSADKLNFFIFYCFKGNELGSVSLPVLTETGPVVCGGSKNFLVYYDFRVLLF